MKSRLIFINEISLKSELWVYRAIRHAEGKAFHYKQPYSPSSCWKQKFMDVNSVLTCKEKQKQRIRLQTYEPSFAKTEKQKLSSKHYSFFL